MIIILFSLTDPTALFIESSVGLWLVLFYNRLSTLAIVRRLLINILDITSAWTWILEKIMIKHLIYILHHSMRTSFHFFKHLVCHGMHILHHLTNLLKWVSENIIIEKSILYLLRPLRGIKISSGWRVIGIRFGTHCRGLETIFRGSSGVRIL